MAAPGAAPAEVPSPRLVGEALPPKPSGLARLLETITEASLTLLIGLPPGAAPALKPAEVVRRALEGLLQEPCDLMLFASGAETVAVVVNPRSRMAFDPVLAAALIEQLRQALERDLGAPAVRIAPLGYVTPVGAREENLASLGELLDTIVNRRLNVQFMPIVNLNVGEVYGYEALIRAPQGGVLNRMGLMFETADRARLVSWLDMACQEQCFTRAAAAGAREYLFFNMDAEGLVHMQMSERSLADRAREIGIPPNRVVMEITERQAVEDYPRLEAYIAEVRSQGFKIAIDDAGSGYNSLAAIAEIRPEFVKIGRPLIRSIESNGARRALLRCLSDYTMQIGTALIAEGIETYDELATVMDLGVPYGQGYMLGRPDDGFRNVRRSTRELLAGLAERRRRRTCGRSYPVADVRTNGLTVEASAPLEAAIRKLSRNPDVASVVLIEEDRPVGFITRADLEHTMLAGAADVTEPVPPALIREPSLADADAPVEDAAALASHRPAERMTDDLVLVRNGQYVGVVTAPALLEALAHLCVRQSLRTHPVTEAPGRVMLEEAFAARLTQSMPTAAVCVEVVGIEDVNATEGYQRGDELLRAVSDLLDDLRARAADSDAFIGHTHGGRFYTLLAPGHARRFAEETSAEVLRVLAPLAVASSAQEANRTAVRVTAALSPPSAERFADVERVLRETRRRAGAATMLALDPSLPTARR